MKNWFASLLRQPATAARSSEPADALARDSNQTPHAALARLRRAIDGERLDDARAFLAALSAEDAELPDGLLLAGRLAVAESQWDQAERLFRRVLDVQPRNPHGWNNLGIALHGQRRYDEALPAARRAIELAPGNADFAFNLSTLLIAVEQYDEAIRLLAQRAQQFPDETRGHVALGEALVAASQFGDALLAFDRALALDDRCIEASLGKAQALLQLGQFDAARSEAGRAAELDSSNMRCRLLMGWILQMEGKLDAAIDEYRQAVAADPGGYGGYSNLGAAYFDAERLDLAEAALRRAIEIDPDKYEAHSNLGMVLQRKGRLEEALAAYRAAVNLNPRAEIAALNVGILLLRLGRFEEGWPAYRARFGFGEALKETFADAEHEWQGEALAGKTLLVRAEQGYGDQIQFVRYVPMVAAQAAEVILQADKALLPLFGCLAGGKVRLVDRDDPPAPYDLFAPIVSLAERFGTRLDSIPAAVPYLSVPADRREQWRQRLTVPPGKLGVGIVWAGNPKFKADARRSVPLEQWAALLATPGVQFYSLQLGDEARAELAAQPPELRDRIVDLANDLTDFAATAAALERLDLVIAVDTAIVHLAGALNRPAWVLHRSDGCWRWIEGREDSPWYPSLAVFAQGFGESWTDVLARVTDRLRHAVKAAGRGI